MTESWNIFWHLPSFVESLRIEGLDDFGLREDEKMVTSWSDSIVDISKGNNTKVIVYKKGVIYEEGKDQMSIDSSRVFVLNDSCIVRPVKI